MFILALFATLVGILYVLSLVAYAVGFFLSGRGRAMAFSVSSYLMTLVVMMALGFFVCLLFWMASEIVYAAFAE